VCRLESALSRPPQNSVATLSKVIYSTGLPLLGGRGGGSGGGSRGGRGAHHLGGLLARCTLWVSSGAPRGRACPHVGAPWRVLAGVLLLGVPLATVALRVPLLRAPHVRGVLRGAPLELVGLVHVSPGVVLLRGVLGAPLGHGVGVRAGASLVAWALGRGSLLGVAPASHGGALRGGGALLGAGVHGRLGVRGKVLLLLLWLLHLLGRLLLL